MSLVITSHVSRVFVAFLVSLVVPAVFLYLISYDFILKSVYSPKSILPKFNVEGPHLQIGPPS